MHANASSANTKLFVWDVGDPQHHGDDLPHGAACAPSGCNARGLGRQQRDHCHGRGPGQQAAPYLENQDWAEGESLCQYTVMTADTFLLCDCQVVIAYTLLSSYRL